MGRYRTHVSLRAVTSVRESSYDSRDFRDDRVYTYFNLGWGETKKFVVLLTASYRGTYSVPAILCEAMYDDGVRARRPGREVNVTEPKVRRSFKIIIGRHCCTDNYCVAGADAFIQ